jgi:hypothetical protein
VFRTYNAGVAKLQQPDHSLPPLQPRCFVALSWDCVDEADPIAHLHPTELLSLFAPERKPLTSIQASFFHDFSIDQCSECTAHAPGDATQWRCEATSRDRSALNLFRFLSRKLAIERAQHSRASRASHCDSPFAHAQVLCKQCSAGDNVCFIAFGTQRLQLMTLTFVGRPGELGPDPCQGKRDNEHATGGHSTLFRVLDLIERSHCTPKLLALRLSTAQIFGGHERFDLVIQHFEDGLDRSIRSPPEGNLCSITSWINQSQFLAPIELQVR